MNIKNIVILVLLVAVLGLVYLYFGSSQRGKTLTIEEASEKALSYINNVLLAGGLQAELTGEVVESNGLYKLPISLAGQEFFSYITKDGQLLFPEGMELPETIATSTEGEPANGTGGSDLKSVGSTLAYFNTYDVEVCQEQGKPIVYFFGSTSCPHCVWEHPVMEKAVEKFAGLISFHNNMDSSDDNDIFLRYNPNGSVPTMVLGCKYARVGSGSARGEEEELRNLTALICDLTAGKPTEVCLGVQDLIDQLSL